MSFLNLKKMFYFQDETQNFDEEQHQAGTGFMLCLTDAIRELQKQGYDENLVPEFDHLSCRSGEIKLYPKEFFIDDMIRFENSSDPDDQSILYAITCEDRKLKGLYVESYGVYHDELSAGMLERIKHCRSHPKKSSSKPLAEKPSIATRLRDRLDHLLD